MQSKDYLQENKINIVMDGQKISEIEDFANINSNIKMLGYDPATNKPGMVNIATLQSKIPYCGVRFAKANSSPEGEPIGDLQMLQQLPSILGLGGYLVKNDHSRQKLDASNHFKLASGGTAKLDGTMGHYQWGWNIPFYYAMWEDDTYVYEAVSTAPMSGRWNYKIPVASIACSGASALDRKNNILVSYCNRTAQYRGGNNDETNDSAWNTLLGKPVTNVAENLLQKYAEKNGDRWGASMFPMIFMIGVLCRIIFHNRNIQAAYNATLTSDGLHQGGLGPGVDNVNTSFSNQYGTVDIDALADKGDALGVFNIDVKDGDTTKLTIKNIPCFYGLKNFYHYIYLMMHGCNAVCNSDYTQTIYAQKIWTKDAVVTDTVTGMEQVGIVPATSAAWTWIFGKVMNLQHLIMFPTEFGGSSSTYYCDGYVNDHATSGVRGLLALGTAGYGDYAGSGCLGVGDGPSYANARCGGAVCEAEEDWKMEPVWQA
jgi:hypothetical protein